MDGADGECWLLSLYVGALVYVRSAENGSKLASGATSNKSYFSQFFRQVNWDLNATSSNEALSDVVLCTLCFGWKLHKSVQCGVVECRRNYVFRIRDAMSTPHSMALCAILSNGGEMFLDGNIDKRNVRVTYNDFDDKCDVIELKKVRQQFVEKLVSERVGPMIFKQHGANAQGVKPKCNLDDRGQRGNECGYIAAWTLLQFSRTDVKSLMDVKFDARDFEAFLSLLKVDQSKWGTSNFASSDEEVDVSSVCRESTIVCFNCLCRTCVHSGRSAKV